VGNRKTREEKMNEVVAVEKVTIPVVVDAEQFWSAVFGSAWETWDWWVSLNYLEGSDWDKVGQVEIAGLDPDGDQETDIIKKVLGLDDIVKAFSKAVTDNKSFGGFDPHELDLDACDGDVVIQYAMFGDVVYG
jgi:hypothetical protein